jgi:hypothetical protein
VKEMLSAVDGKLPVAQQQPGEMEVGNVARYTQLPQAGSGEIVVDVDRLSHQLSGATSEVCALCFRISEQGYSVISSY